MFFITALVVVTQCLLLAVSAQSQGLLTCLSVTVIRLSCLLKFLKMLSLWP